MTAKLLGQVRSQSLHAADAVAGAVALLFVTSVGVTQGGYFPTAWGWSALGLLLISFAFIILGPPVSASRRELLFVGAFVSYVGFAALSAFWSVSVGRSLQEAARGSVYASIAITAAVVLRRSSAAAVAAGIAAAVTVVAACALATRLAPGAFGYDASGLYRLARPIGYWNGLASLVAAGIVLSVDLSLRPRSRVLRGAAAASLPLLCLTMYFTFSRGGAAALALGLAAYIGLHPRRRELVIAGGVLAFISGVGILLASRLAGLVRAGEGYPTAANDGHRLGVVLPLLMAASAVVGIAAPGLRRSPRQLLQRVRSPVVLLVIAELAIAIVLIAYAPVPVPKAAAVPSVAGNSLPARLFSLGTTSRTDYWRVAWTEFTRHPVLGSGAGTFDLYWDRLRPVPAGSRFAHNLYLQTLAELGPIGLALLLTAILVPISAAFRVRGAPAVPALAGAYVAILLHAAVDWDWQLPAVMGTAILAGAAILAAARAKEQIARGHTTAWLLIATAAVAGWSAASWHANEALSRATVALAKQQYPRALADARAAQRWQPWASEPWRISGLAQLGLDHPELARTAFAHAVRRDRSDWQTWFDLSAVTAGRARAAALRQARALNPLAPELKRSR